MEKKVLLVQDVGGNRNHVMQRFYDDLRKLPASLHPYCLALASAKDIATASAAASVDVVIIEPTIGFLKGRIAGCCSHQAKVDICDGMSISAVMRHSCKNKSRIY